MKRAIICSVTPEKGSGVPKEKKGQTMAENAAIQAAKPDEEMAEFEATLARVRAAQKAYSTY